MKKAVNVSVENVELVNSVQLLRKHQNVLSSKKMISRT